MPLVTVRSWPNGLPIATTGAPTCRSLDEPSGMTVSAEAGTSTLRTATSVALSTPTTLACTFSLLEKETEIGPFAPSTTCALVRMWPSLSMTKPEPRPPECSTRTTPAPSCLYIWAMLIWPSVEAGATTALELLALLDGCATSRTTVVVVEPPSWLTIAAVPPAARPADRSEAISTGTTMRDPRGFLLWFAAAGGGVVESGV